MLLLKYCLMEMDFGATASTGTPSPHFFVLFANLISLQLPPQPSPCLVMSLEWGEGAWPGLSGKISFHSGKLRLCSSRRKHWSSSGVQLCSPRMCTAVTTHFLKAPDSRCVAGNTTCLCYAMGWSNISEEIVCLKWMAQLKAGTSKLAGNCCFLPV